MAGFTSARKGVRRVARVPRAEEQPMTQPTTTPSAGAQDEWQAPSWEEIVSEHSARVYRLAYRLTGSPHDAEDLTQEVFVRVFRSLSSYTPGTFEGWLHRITTNLFLDQARRKAKIRFDALADDAESRIPHNPPPRQAPPQGEDPLRRAGRRRRVPDPQPYCRTRHPSPRRALRRR